jgi:hypothetical protein
MGKQNPRIEEQTTKWPKEKKTNNDLQNTTQKPGWTEVLRKGSNSYTTSGTSRVTLVTNPVLSHD